METYFVLVTLKDDEEDWCDVFGSYDYDEVLEEVEWHDYCKTKIITTDGTKEDLQRQLEELNCATTDV